MHYSLIFGNEIQESNIQTSPEIVCVLVLGHLQALCVCSHAAHFPYEQNLLWDILSL